MADAQGGRDSQALALQCPTLHRWQRIRGPDGQWYRKCYDCGTQLIDRYKEDPPPTAIG